LYVGPRGAMPARVLERHGCGWRVEPGDAGGLVRLLERLEQDRSLVQEAGARARSAFEKHYDKPIGVARILAILGVSETPSPAPASLIAASSVELRCLEWINSHDNGLQ